MYKILHTIIGGIGQYMFATSKVSGYHTTLVTQKKEDNNDKDEDWDTDLYAHGK